MSLGITALWRVRPQQRLALLIPREPLLFKGPPTSRFSPSTQSTTVSPGVSYYSTAQDSTQSGDGADTAGDVDRAHAGDDLPKPSLIKRVKAKGRTNEPGIGHRTRRRRDRAPKNEVQRLEESLERSNFVKSVLVQPAKIYPHKVATRESFRDHHKSVSAQVHSQRARLRSFESGIAADPNATDWRQVLSLLTRQTQEQPNGWIEGGIKVELPESVFATIMEGGGDVKIGAIRRRTGASIKASKGQQPGDSPSLLLSGSRQAINRATEELRNIAGSITVTRLLSPLTPDEARTKLGDGEEFFVPPLSREEGGPFRRVKVDYDIRTTPWPETLSHRTFEAYVASLTDSVILPNLNSPFYNPTKYATQLDHERAVARQLQRAFTRQRALPWVSCSALKLALSYLCEKGDKYLPEARSIFVSMDQHGLRMDVDVFNILLRAPTKARNLRKFQQTLMLMTRRGFAPNLHTWILFLRMVESVEVKSYILRAMHMKNLLSTPEAIQRVAEEMARFDADHAVQRRKDLETFMQEQDERYGPDWLTRDAGNQVLGVLCQHSRYQDAFKLLNRMHARANSIPLEFKADIIAARPDIVSYNTIMSHAKRQGKFNLMVDTICKMKSVTFATQPDSTSLHLLFEMAWHLRMRATVSVIWRYAALAHLTTPRMRQRVAGLLSWKPGETDESATYGISPAAYRRLGGEKLARELVGGKAALDRIRYIAAGRHRAELAVLAAKVWPEAFDDFGPTISLGSALSLAASMDWKFFQTQKEGEQALHDLLRKTKPKLLPLKGRRPAETGWIDFAPLMNVDPDRIRPEDGWSDFKDLNLLLSEGRKERKGLGIHDKFGNEFSRADDEAVTAEGQSCEERGLFRKVMAHREMAIMDPELWFDDEAISADGRQRHSGWSALKMVMEQDLLAALEELEKAYPSVQEGLPPPQLLEDAADADIGVVEESNDTDQIDSGRDHQLLVQDDVTSLAGIETQDTMTVHGEEVEGMPEELDIHKDGAHNGK